MRSSARTSRLRRPGFTLIELAVVASVLAVTVAVFISYASSSRSQIVAAGDQYAEDYGDAVDTAASAGTELPDWSGAGRNGQAFTILNSSDTTVPGVYVYREGSNLFYSPTTGTVAGPGIDGPWEPALGCLAGLPIASASVTTCWPAE
jgi:prepilin-type N-terminal cleavage/methylation domain-containing protein